MIYIYMYLCDMLVWVCIFFEKKEGPRIVWVRLRIVWVAEREATFLQKRRTEQWIQRPRLQSKTFSYDVVSDLKAWPDYPRPEKNNDVIGLSSPQGLQDVASHPLILDELRHRTSKFPSTKCCISWQPSRVWHIYIWYDIKYIYICDIYTYIYVYMWYACLSLHFFLKKRGTQNCMS